MKHRFKNRLFSERKSKPQGCSLIDRMAALAQSSHDLNTALGCAADEIGESLGLERVAILLRREGGMRRVGDYCAHSLGPIGREKLRQLDSEIAGGLDSRGTSIEAIDTSSDPRVIRVLQSTTNRVTQPMVKAILI